MLESPRYLTTVDSCEKELTELAIDSRKTDSTRWKVLSRSLLDFLVFFHIPTRNDRRRQGTLGVLRLIFILNLREVESNLIHWNNIAGATARLIT
jgi:hypothetical protein